MSPGLLSYADHFQSRHNSELGSSNLNYFSPIMWEEKSQPSNNSSFRRQEAEACHHFWDPWHGGEGTWEGWRTFTWIYSVCAANWVFQFV